MRVVTRSPGLRALLASLLLAMALLPCAARGQELMTPELLWKLGRVGGGSISPDGAWVLYSVRRYDLVANRGDSDLWLVPLAGGKARQLSSGPGSESEAQWVKRPGGARIFCIARREGDADPQVWSLDPGSGSFSRVTKIPGGVANLKVAPTGDRIAFTRDIKLDKTPQELHPDLKKAEARIIDHLMYRHWDRWDDYKYSHLHVADLRADGSAGPARDLMAGMKVDCPVPPFSGSEDFAFSPDGKEIAYVAKIARDWAQSTDSDIYLVDLESEGPTRCITHGMNGYDTTPNYSPDGRWIAFGSMKRAGFESDRNRIMLYSRESGRIHELSKGLDQTTHEISWHPDSQSLWFMSETRGTDQIYRLPIAKGAAAVQITQGWHNWSLRGISPDGKTLSLGRRDMIRPWEIYRMATKGGRATPLTDVNAAVYAKLKLPTIRQRWVRASDGKRIHNWVILPPDFDPKKKYPMLTYCQGGPQGQIGQWFSYRWNFHLMAAQGYVVLAVNRRGLPGFGREWNDEISKDWGGQAMQDILASTDDMFTEPFVDRDHTAAIGASFGGYTVYWMMGNAEGRFCSMVAHAGVFNMESMYGATEELFFVNWDLGGPYWKSEKIRKAYDRFSPHRYVQNWKTPILIIHGQRDYRVPVTQGMEAFTAAQVQGVPSKFLYFPDEGHWILSPQNGLLWHRTFFSWLDRWCKPGNN